MRDFPAGGGLADLHPGLQFLTRRREGLDHDTHPAKAGATIEDNVATGIALFYIGHADEIILAD